MNSVEQSTKLLSIVKELSDIESNEIELMVGIFKRNIADITESYLEKISKDFSFKCEFYGKKIDDVRVIHEEIISGYKKEFQKISEKLEEQYVNLMFELQEIQMNQMIAVTNYKKMLDNKSKFEASNEYLAYKNKLENLVSRRDDAETKKEFDELEEELANLVDPIIKYENSIDAIVQKYGNYCALEEECFSKIKECEESVKDALSTVMKYDTEALAVVKKGGIFSAFKKIFNKLFAGKKFEKQFVKIKKENIARIEADTNILTEEIKNKTIEYIETLMIYKAEVKEVYEQTA